jgi:phage terminase large subunit-like protein
VGTGDRSVLLPGLPAIIQQVGRAHADGALLLAGRGFGKSLSGANWCHELVQSGKYGHLALVAPTAADARDTMIEGVSGILATAPEWNRPTNL